ncbi:hypothetical protein HGRIS_011144 [Hohenbuehelia grisea]|uniref:Uncharacterized protein n=1 Tax=Hohenbuehelia grisea TaxID=104357 RepID=A0ABR3IZF6_9AGAR
MSHAFYHPPGGTSWSRHLGLRSNNGSVSVRHLYNSQGAITAFITSSLCSLAQVARFDASLTLQVEISSKSDSNGQLVIEPNHLSVNMAFLKPAGT